MSEDDNSAGDLFAIEVDTEEYAETAAGDVPTQVSRTHQSEADFIAQKASYSAKVDDGNLIKQLYEALPLLKRRQPSQDADDRSLHTDVNGSSDGLQTRKLGKREVQLVGYAVGELYYDRQYSTVIELCESLTRSYALDSRTSANLKKWSLRSGERILALS